MADVRHSATVKSAAGTVLEALRSGHSIRLRDIQADVSEGTLRRAVGLLRALGAPIISGVGIGNQLTDPSWPTPYCLRPDNLAVIIERTIQAPERIRIVRAADLSQASVSQLVAELRRRGCSVAIAMPKGEGPGEDAVRPQAL